MESDHRASRALCLGEAMAVLRPEQPGGLEGSDLLRRSVGGAEANVAGGLASLGIPTTWMSRLGSDPFGDFVVRDLTARGVDVAVEQDDQRPTGLYLKEAGTGSRMYYYRSNSAATTMDGSLLRLPRVAETLPTCRVVHTSGITAGILADDSDLLPRLVEARDRYDFRLSVDLNWRPHLWQGRDPAALRELLTVADVLLLGADEAEEVLGRSDPAGLREAVGPRPRLVIKSDAHAVVEVAPDGTTVQVPALAVDVVEPIGAGDGFAAGYLAGLIQGRDAVGRLRLGHLMAASVLAEPGDHAVRPLPEALCRAAVEATDEEWRSIRVSRTGIDAAALGFGVDPGGAR